MGFLRFWYDFIIGDAWEVAVGVVVTLALSWEPGPGWLWGGGLAGRGVRVAAALDAWLAGAALTALTCGPSRHG
jgi:hypothetical protein